MESKNKNIKDNCSCVMCQMHGGMHGKTGCCGEACGHGYRGGRFLFKLVIGLIILGVVFSIGVKLGELNAYYGLGYSGYGYREMMGRRGIWGPGMMWGYYDVPAEKATTTTK